MNDKTIVEVDFWENQTYKSLQGAWSVPYYGVQKFSDATGSIAFKHEKTMNGTVYLPLGWEWVDKAWAVDRSGKFGDTDAEGWSYGTTIEQLVEQTRLQALKADRSTANVMRRRRWVRCRKCVIPDVIKLHIERVDWAEGIRSKMQEVEDINKANYFKLSEYYTNQKDAIERVIICTDNNILDVINDFSDLTERLLALRAFLTERGAIEESHAQKLDLFSKKWLNEGDAKKPSHAPGTVQSSPFLLTSDPNVDIFAEGGLGAAFWNSTTNALKTAATATTAAANNAASVASSAANNAATAANYAANAASAVAVAGVRRMSLTEVDSANASSDSSDSSSSENGSSARLNEDGSVKMDSDSFSSDVGFKKVGTSRGILDDYYYSVCLAKRTAGQRMHDYAQLLTHTLPQQVDGILEVVREAVAECRTEGRDIRSNLMANCKATEQRFNNYTQSFEQAQSEIRSDNNQLLIAVYQSSATVDFPTNDFSSTGGGMGSVYSASTGTYGDSTAAGDAAAAAINRFSNLDSQDLWLAIQLYFTSANSVDSILLMYHAFSKMALRKLRDITATMDELLNVTLRTFSTEQFSAWEDCSSALAALGGYRDILLLQTKPLNSSSQDSHASDERSPSKSVAVGGVKLSPLVTRKKAGSADGASILTSTEDNNDGEPDVYESSGRNNASVFRSNFFSRLAPSGYIAYHGRLSYCTTTRAEAHTGAVDFTEHSMWHEVTVLLTYNRILHIMHVPHEGNVNDTDDLKYSKEAHIMSVNVRNVLVKPFVIAKEGYGDAFEVLLAGSGSKKMGMLGTLSSSSKEITALIFLAHDSFQMRSWMRAIANPFTDPTKNPPDSPPPAATNVAPQQTSSAAASSSTSSTAAACSDPDGFGFGGDDMVSGTNSLREARSGKLSNTSTPSKPAGNTSTAATGSDGFTVYSGSDAVGGMNALRKPAGSASAAPASDNFTSYSGSDAVGGVNALRKPSNAESSVGGVNLMRKPSNADVMGANPMKTPVKEQKGSESPNTGRPAGLEGFTMYTGSDAVGGSNALRRLKKTPSAMGPGMGSSFHNVLSAAATTAGSAATAVSGASSAVSGTLSEVVTGAGGAFNAALNAAATATGVAPAAEAPASGESTPATPARVADSAEAAPANGDNVPL